MTVSRQATDTAERTDMESHDRHWPALKAFSGHQQDSGLRAWLAVMEGTLKAIERTAWQGRELAQQALSAWRASNAAVSASPMEPMPICKVPPSRTKVLACRPIK